MAVIATQSNYSMGQYRGIYSPPNESSGTTSQSDPLDTYRTNIGVLEGPFFAIKNSEKDDSLPFRDPLIRPNTEFQAGTTYFLRLQINRHTFKDMTYAIKLVKSQPDPNRENHELYDEKDYQYLKRVTVNSSSSTNENSENVAIVTVYKTSLETEEGSTPEGGSNSEELIAEEVIPGGESGTGESSTQTEPTVRYFSSLSPASEDTNKSEVAAATAIAEDFAVVYEENHPFVNLSYSGSGTPEPIGSFKISLLENSSSESAEIVEVLFTPTKNYSAIVIEKERDNSDWTTFFEDGKNSFNGFETSIRNDVKIYSLKNLLKIADGEDSAIAAKPNKISKIGVWGRSNLCLNCNGEEIRIGPRGYYEMSFDETLGLSSFGVLAESESDFPFLIDYEYILS